MTRLSLSKAWDEARAVLQRDGRLVASVALALVLLPQAIAGVIAPPPNLSGEDAPAWMPVVSIVVALAGIVGQIAIIRLAIGPSTSVGEAINHGVRRVVPGFLALLLFALALAIVLIPLFILIAGGASDLQAIAEGAPPAPAVAGAIMLIGVLAVLASVRFQLLMPVTSGEPGGPIHILKRSWELTRGNYWRMLAFLLLVIVIAIVLVGAAQITGGILGRVTFGDIKPLTVGALLVALLIALAQAVFSAVVSVMLARIYVQLAGRGQAQASVPSSGT